LKISIITATYNSAATLADTMQSVARQDHPDIEHIIVDGLSSDDSIAIARSFPHVAKSISEKDGGIYDAMNKGIALASGDVIGILNSDDFYTHPQVLSKVANAFTQDDVDVVYGDLQYVQRDNVDKVVRSWRSGPYKKNSFYYGWMPPHPTFFVRKSAYSEVGLFNTSLRMAADYELMLRMLVKHNLKPAYVPEVLVKMRDGGVSNVSVNNRVKANREDRLAWKMNGLQPYFFTLYCKPLRKIVQYLIR
jgi:glycosyltransferase involved in cell wall biosynthesis